MKARIIIFLTLISCFMFSTGCGITRRVITTPVRIITFPIRLLVVEDQTYYYSGTPLNSSVSYFDNNYGNIAIISGYYSEESDHGVHHRRVQFH